MREWGCKVKKERKIWEENKKNRLHLSVHLAGWPYNTHTDLGPHLPCKNLGQNCISACRLS